MAKVERPTDDGDGVAGPKLYSAEMASLVEAIHIKRKAVFEFENAPYACLDSDISTPTARGGQTLVRLKMRNLLTQAVFEKTFKAQDKFKEPDLELVPVSYLYSDGEGSHFLDQNSFETLTLGPTQLNDALEYLIEGTLLQILKYNGNPIGLQLPIFVELTVSQTEPGIRGDSSSGGHLPWNDPLATAQQMAKDLFQWTSSDPQDTVLDNNGKIAHVQLNHPDTNMQVTVTLSRLLQQNTNGLWFVIGTQTAGITLDPSSIPTPVTSPIALKGTVGTASGTLVVNLFDHTLNPLQLPTTTPITADTQGTFAGSIAYNNNAPQQPGLLLIEEMPPAGSSAAGQLLLTRMILG